MKRTHDWIVAILGLVLLAPLSPAMAAVQDIRVIAVGIDTSSAAADEKAMDYARKRAVYLAARKLGVKEPSKEVAKLTEEQWKDIIRGTNVVQSKRKGDTTWSEVNVTIVDEQLKRALKITDKPADEPDHLRGVLVLPVYVGKDRATVWEKENVLRAPLWDEVRRQARAGVLLPGGDLEDLRLIDYQNALTVKPEELKPMYARYGAEEIIIAVLTPGAANTPEVSKVLLRRLNVNGEIRNEVLEIAPEAPEENAVVRLNKAAAAIANAVTQIASSTAERDQAIRAKAKKIKVRFAYAIPRDLARMETAVRASPEVYFLDLPSIALAQVSGTIYLKGDDEALRESLIKQGFVVTSINDGWRIAVR